uniref:(northern house mosquito) hypothetical protein n=1 Tax=Culex pipiens TaxID=7175 RepID=A0A8D8H1G0_CULPI
MNSSKDSVRAEDGVEGSTVEDSHPDTEKSRICDPSDPAAGVRTDRHQFAAMVRKGPFQPSLSEYPITRFGGKKRAFRKAWYAVHDWLEYSIITDKTFCFVCRLFGKENSGKGGHSDPAFVSTGFQTGKRQHKLSRLMNGAISTSAARKHFLLSKHRKELMNSLMTKNQQC